MATRYRVLGTSNWDASSTANWSASSGGAAGASAPGSGDDVIFDANSGGGTVTMTADQSVASITWSGYGGTLDTAGFTLTVAGTFNLGSSGTRVLTLGSSTVNVGTWTVASSSNLTLNANTSTINITGSGVWTVGNAVTYATVNITPPADASIDINGAFTVGTLVLNQNASGSLSVNLGTNFTINTAFTLNGVSESKRLLVRAQSFGFQRTISGTPTVTGQYVDLQDIYFPSVSPDLSAITGGSGDCGGNNNITFTSPTTQHWIAGGDGSGNWGTTANWTSRVPLPQDDAVMDLAFGSGATVTVDVPRIGKSIDWSGATYTTSLTWTIGSATSMYGSLIFTSGMTVTSSTLTLSGRSAFTLTGGGSSLTINLDINAPSGTYTMGSDLTLVSSRSLTVTRGTLDANDYAITAGSLTLTSSATTSFGSATHTITSNGSVFTGAGTINAETSTIKFTDTSNNDITFTGGTKTYYNVWFDRAGSTGSITISGSNTFNEIKDSGTAAHSFLSTAGITTRFAVWSIRGSSGNAITINSTTTGTHAFVKIGVGIVQTDWLNIQHSVATPGNTFFAGANSVNNQATATAGSGWLFWEKANFRKPTRPALFKPGNAR